MIRFARRDVQFMASAKIQNKLKRSLAFCIWRSEKRNLFEGWFWKYFSFVGSFNAFAKNIYRSNYIYLVVYGKSQGVLHNPYTTCRSLNHKSESHINVLQLLAKFSHNTHRTVERRHNNNHMLKDDKSVSRQDQIDVRFVWGSSRHFFTTIDVRSDRVYLVYKAKIKCLRKHNYLAEAN